MTFPVDQILDDICCHLNDAPQVLVQAPPGSGKSTRIPLHLLKQSGISGKIIMLEPRRIAAKSLAQFLAQQLGESVGQTVGYRMRQDTKVSTNTRLEIVTEGVLTRMLQQDAMLDGIDVIIFDEFHERHLQSDLALALCLDVQEGLRDDLRLIIMSATLDAQALQKMLPQAASISTQGRTYPVDISYQGNTKRHELINTCVRTVVKACEENDGSVLCFLPGRGEIMRCQQQLKQVLDTHIDVMALYGDLTIEQQQHAIAAPPQGKRKVVLATNIAETSLTIDGISVVVDSGLERRAEYMPAVNMDRLVTRYISQASATQRAGRAGRLMPGCCYRLWSESQQQGMAKAIPAEIEHCELTNLALELARWQVDAEDLRWLTPPPSSRLTAAFSLLSDLGIVVKQRLSAHGKDVCQIGCHPRFAHAMVKSSDDVQKRQLSAAIAALLEQRDLANMPGTDMRTRLQALNQHPRQYAHVLRQAQRHCRQISLHAPGIAFDAVDEVLITMFPDRLARATGKGRYVLANGRGARLDEHDALLREQWLVVADATGDGQGDLIIRRAVAVDIESLIAQRPDLYSEQQQADWDVKSGRFVAKRCTRIAGLIYNEAPISADVSSDERVAGLISLIRQQGLEFLPLDEAAESFLVRCQLAQQHCPDLGLPVTDEDVLLAELDAWLAMYLQDVMHLRDLKKLPWQKILSARLDYAQQQALDSLVQTRYKVASGNTYAIDYVSDPQQPKLSLKLQEMFGQPSSPTIARGKLPLLIELLSPAGRPLQVTMDLASFWQNGYEGVKKEMRGRYPKHPWPDDPIAALPTHMTKRKLVQQK